VSDILITHSAFGRFYGATFAVLVDAKIYARIKAFLPPAVSVFIFRTDGVIALAETFGADGGESSKAECLPLIGMNIGLEAIIVSKSRLGDAENLVSYCEKQGMFRLPAMHIVRLWPYAWKQEAIRFISTILWEYAARKCADLSTAQQQLVHLRTHYERLWLSFEKARRMIRGVGYATRSVAFSLSPGGDTIGPDAPKASHHYQQYLPTDLAGFAGLKLFVSQAADTKASGDFIVGVRRMADNALVGEATLPFSEIHEGWLSFAFDEAVPLTHGDGKLEILWKGKGGPLLAMADGRADRFGDDAGRSLALQIIKGLADPTLDTVEFMPLERTTFSGNDLLELGSFYAGGEAERKAEAAVGDKILQANDDGGWLQTHLIAGGPSGVRLPDILQQHAKGIRVGIETAHKAAPTCIYMLLALRRDMPATGVERILQGLGCDKELALAGADAVGGFYWSSIILEPLKNATLTLKLEDALDERLDVILAVRSMTGKFDYGHCRWLRMEVSQEVDRANELVTLDPEILHEGLEYQSEIRTHRLTELAGRLNFYKGRAELEKLSEKLGFSPFLVSEETGALQTHPYDGLMSAAVLDGGLPVGTQRLSCEVGTAHASAPEFIYMIAVLPCGIKNREVTIEGIATRVSAGEVNGIDENIGVQWNSVRLKALKVRTLAVELSKVSEQVGDVVFAVIPASENVSYGWCRWYSFEAALMDVDMKAHLLKRSQEELVRAQ